MLNDTFNRILKTAAGRCRHHLCEVDGIEWNSASTGQLLILAEWASRWLTEEEYLELCQTAKKHPKTSAAATIVLINSRDPENPAHALFTCEDVKRAIETLCKRQHNPIEILGTVGISRVLINSTKSHMWWWTKEDHAAWEAIPPHWLAKCMVIGIEHNLLQAVCGIGISQTGASQNIPPNLKVKLPGIDIVHQIARDPKTFAEYLVQWPEIKGTYKNKGEPLAPWGIQVQDMRQYIKPQTRPDAVNKMQWNYMKMEIGPQVIRISSPDSPKKAPQWFWINNHTVMNNTGGTMAESRLFRRWAAAYKVTIHDTTGWVDQKTITRWWEFNQQLENNPILGTMLVPYILRILEEGSTETIDLACDIVDQMEDDRLKKQIIPAIFYRHKNSNNRIESLESQNHMVKRLRRLIPLGYKCTAKETSLLL